MQKERSQKFRKEMMERRDRHSITSGIDVDEFAKVAWLGIMKTV